MKRWRRTKHTVEKENEEKSETREGGDPAYVLVTAMGLSDTQVADVVELVMARAAREQFTPVFVTDVPCPEVFLRHKAIFEYIPKRASRAPALRHLDWGPYIERRFHFLVDKWRPMTAVSFGQTVPIKIASTQSTSDE